MLCCLFAPPEALTDEPELYDCDRCEVSAQLRDLSPENRRAWDVFHKLARRLPVDAHLAGAWWATLTAEENDVEGLMDRLALIYDYLQPPQVARGA
jgi:hypothetical protein